MPLFSLVLQICSSWGWSISARLRLVVACAVFFTGFAVSASDPNTRWSTIETPHFTVIYDSKQQQLGRIYAADAENAFAAVALAFGVWPEKTVIYVDDSTDLANGSATPWPYSLIMAYPVLPLTNDVVGDYGNWSQELLTHEYTHILNFAPANGIFKPLRWVFGSIVSPNVLLPRWYSEGLAVEMETRYSKYGRLRSSGFLSIARAMAIEGKLRGEDIGRINESIPEFPGGNRPYLMGALIWDELTRRAGDQIIGDLNTAYSRRIPFLIDGPLIDRLHIGWQSLLDDVYDRVEKRTLEQVALINSASPQKEKLVARDGYYTRSPAISPDGTKLVYVSQAHNTDNLIQMIERSDVKRSFATLSQKPNQLVESAEINRVSWLPDSSGFIFDSVDTVNRYYAYSDLWSCTLVADQKKCKLKKLSRGLRAREPVVSPDGRALVFVQNTPGSTRLAVAHLDAKDDRVLYEPPIETRISSPTFVSPTMIVFSERQGDGKEFLREMKLTEDAHGLFTPASPPTDVLTSFAPVHFPEMTTRGLLFMSDKTGVTNLYLADAQLKSARALTNTTTKILDGAVDATTGDVLFSRLEASGAALFAETDAESRAMPAVPPNVPPLIDTAYPGLSQPQVLTPMEQSDYHPSHYLLPKYWLPFAYLLPGGVYAEATTSGADPVGLHRYSLTGAYDSLSKKPSAFGSYTNSTTPVPITLIGQDINEFLYSLNTTRQTVAGGLSGSFFLPQLNNHYRGSLGWQYLQTDILGTSTIRSGARLTLGYTNVEQRGYEISPEKGGSLVLGQARYFEPLGSIGYDQTDISASKFFSGFILPDRHVLAFFLNGTYAPDLKSSLLGRSTVGGNYQNGLIQDAFVMRGYDSGVFLGRSLVAGTAEYRFPILYRYQGIGSYPIFFRRLHAALFVDAITLDGGSYVASLKSYQSERLGTFHLGTGAELKIDTTLFYFLPVQFVVGAYTGLDKTLNPNGVFPFIGFGL